MITQIGQIVPTSPDPIVAGQKYRMAAASVRFAHLQQVIGKVDEVIVTLNGLSGATGYQGTYTPPAALPAATKDWYYKVAAAGTIPGPGGPVVEAGDEIICIATNAGGNWNAANWLIVNKDIAPAVALDLINNPTATDVYVCPNTLTDYGFTFVASLVEFDGTIAADTLQTITAANTPYATLSGTTLQAVQNGGPANVNLYLTTIGSGHVVTPAGYEFPDGNAGFYYGGTFVMLRSSGMYNIRIHDSGLIETIGTDFQVRNTPLTMVDVVNSYTTTAKYTTKSISTVYTIPASGSSGLPITIGVPAGARILGTALRNQTPIVLSGVDTYYVAYNASGASQVIATAIPLTADAHAKGMFNSNLNSDIATGSVDLVIQTTGGIETFTSGTIEVVVWYEELGDIIYVP